MRQLPLIGLAAFAALALSFALFSEASTAQEPEPADNAIPIQADDGLKAFDTIYAALTHPRCMNCHPTLDAPLQTDASTPHLMNVKRGRDDRGEVGMRCVTCHNQVPVAGAGMPPGVVGADWHLAPREQAFEGKSKRELAAMLKDPERSHKTGEELIDHVRDDPLVSYGWNPGEGREPLSITRDELVKAFESWVGAGMPLPAEDH